ncbi:MAG TPA: hypothetical protein VGX23_26410 [Actinocrinis sp.]|nr:hypothetical protein [Actinocrinis sp.]
MATRLNSPGTHTEDDEPERTHDAAGYDSTLDDEYDDALGSEARAVPTGNEHESAAEVEAERAGDADSVEGRNEAEAEGDEHTDEFAKNFGNRNQLENEPGDEFAADRTAGPGEHPDMVVEPDPYQLTSPIPGQPNSGPVLTMPGAESDAEADSALGSGSELDRAHDLDHEPGSGSAFESEVGAESGNESRFGQERQVVGAAADTRDVDSGLDEAEGRDQFDEAAGTEDVADYDDSAAGYELAEEEGVNPPTPATDDPALAASPSATAVPSVASASSTSLAGAGAASAPGAVGAVSASGNGGLLSAEAQEELLQRWTAIQVSFVDGPADSVRAADTLIRDIGTAIQNAIHERTDQLTGSWQGTADTEQLRLSLQEYRAFLSVVLPKQ